MITQQFIGLWFILSTIIFAGVKFSTLEQEIPRDWNTLAILASQGLGATGAYIALHT